MDGQNGLKRTSLILAVAFLSSCVSLEKAAPPVETFARGAVGARRTQLEQGRVIYITKCTKCHSAEPVARYSPQRWSKIIPDMAGEAKLGSQETEAVRAYIFAVLKEGRRE